MSCASGCSGVPPMIGGGKKKRITKKKLVKKGGTDFTDEDIELIFNGKQRRKLPPRYTGRQVLGNFKKTKYSAIDIYDFKYVVEQIKDTNIAAVYEWAIDIIDKNNKNLTLSINQGGQVQIITNMTDEEKNNLSLENINKITIGNIDLYSKDYTDESFYRVPFYMLVIIKAIESAVTNGLCTTELCTAGGAALYGFVVKFLNSDLVTAHVENIKQLNIPTRPPPPVVTKADIDELADLLGNLGNPPPPPPAQQMNVQEDPAVILQRKKTTIMNTIRDRLENFESGLDIFKSGNEIDTFISLIKNAHITVLNEQEKSAILSIFNEILLNAAKNYMVLKTSDNRDRRYGNIYLIEQVDKMEATQQPDIIQKVAGYRQVYNQMKGQLNLTGGKNKKKKIIKTRKVRKQKK
jgi:hypothetical protein